MIRVKSIYQVSCDKCVNKKITVNTEYIEGALIALKQHGWKVEHDGCMFWTRCPECAKKGETDVQQ